MAAVTRFGIDGAIWSPVGSFSGKAAGVIVAGGIYNATGYFTTLGSVTIVLYDPLTGIVVATDTDACIEITGTGVYVWSGANLTSEPLTYQEYSWKMTDGTEFAAGTIIFTSPFVTSRINPILHR